MLMRSITRRTRASVPYLMPFKYNITRSTLKAYYIFDTMLRSRLRSKIFYYSRSQIAQYRARLCSKEWLIIWRIVDWLGIFSFTLSLINFSLTFNIYQNKFESSWIASKACKLLRSFLLEMLQCNFHNSD